MNDTTGYVKSQDKRGCSEVNMYWRVSRGSILFSSVAFNMIATMPNTGSILSSLAVLKMIATTPDASLSRQNGMHTRLRLARPLEALIHEVYRFSRRPSYSLLGAAKTSVRQLFFNSMTNGQEASISFRSLYLPTGVDPFSFDPAHISTTC